MCKCVKVEVQSYDNQVLVEVLPEQMQDYRAAEGRVPKLSIDTCLLEEVSDLWSIGITTTGCCCGHNKVPPYIGVIDSDIWRMKAMGYEVKFNHSRPEGQDSFKPKSV